MGPTAGRVAEWLQAPDSKLYFVQAQIRRKASVYRVKPAVATSRCVLLFPFVSGCGRPFLGYASGVRFVDTPVLVERFGDKPPVARPLAQFAGALVVARSVPAVIRDPLA